MGLTLGCGESYCKKMGMHRGLKYGETAAMATRPQAPLG